MSDAPSAGDVFRYPYLWHRQSESGETEGRKTRPSCVAVTSRTEHGETILFLVPITSQKPHADRVAVPVPLIEVKRADLETDKPLWIIVDEVNVDVWERSWYLEDRTPQGHFGAAFVKTIQRLLQQARSAPKVVKRS